MKSPTVTVSLSGKDTTVTFDISRLMAIEEITEAKTYELVSEFSEYFAFGTKKKPPTKEQLVAAAKKFSVRKAFAFVAACLGLSHEELNRSLPLSELQGVFLSLAGGLASAVRQLNGVSEEVAEEPETESDENPEAPGEPHPTGAPQTSAS